MPSLAKHDYDIYLPIFYSKVPLNLSLSKHGYLYFCCIWYNWYRHKHAMEIKYCNGKTGNQDDEITTKVQGRWKRSKRGRIIKMEERMNILIRMLYKDAIYQYRKPHCGDKTTFLFPQLDSLDWYDSKFELKRGLGVICLQSISLGKRINEVQPGLLIAQLHSCCQTSSTISVVIINFFVLCPVDHRYCWTKASSIIQTQASKTIWYVTRLMCLIVLSSSFHTHGYSFNLCRH